MKIWTTAFYVALGLCVGNSVSIASAQPKLISDAAPQCVFSGQEIQIAGQKVTVLSDARGGIILTGNQFVWSNTERNHTGNHLKIEAKNLGSSTL